MGDPIADERDGILDKCCCLVGVGFQLGASLLLIVVPGVANPDQDSLLIVQVWPLDAYLWESNARSEMAQGLRGGVVSKGAARGVDGVETDIRKGIDELRVSCVAKGAVMDGVSTLWVGREEGTGRWGGKMGVWMDGPEMGMPMAGVACGDSSSRRARRTSSGKEGKQEKGVEHRSR